MSEFDETMQAFGPEWHDLMRRAETAVATLRLDTSVLGDPPPLPFCTAFVLPQPDRGEDE